MALVTKNPTRPSAKNDGVNDREIEKVKFLGIVEEAARTSNRFENFFTYEEVKGTSTISKDGQSIAEVQVITREQAPEATKQLFSQTKLTVDTVLLARNTIFILDEVQAKYAITPKMAKEQGEQIGKEKEQALLIQVAKAAMTTQSPYGGLPGFRPATQVTVKGTDLEDPAKIIAKLMELYTQMQEKGVDPQRDNLTIAMAPRQFNILLQSEHMINTQYMTSSGTKIDGWVLKLFGVPVVSTTDMPKGTITGHKMTTSINNYDGDFSKVGVLAFSDRALLCGQSISMTNDVWVDKGTKHTKVDTWTSFASTPDRVEYAGGLFLE